MRCRRRGRVLEERIKNVEEVAKPRLEVSIPGSEKHRLAGLGGI